MLVQQSTTAYPLLFLMVDSTDHITGKTGLSPTVTISKAGGAFASPAGAVTEISSGWYKVAGNATDSNTLGVIALHATGTGADPVDRDLWEVVAFNPQAALATPTNITAATGVVLSGVTHTGAVIPTVSAVTGLTASNLDATISSRMATYTQPTGFLAATFPATVASTTNITGGTITTVTNLTNLPAITANWLTAAGTAADFGAEMATAIWTDTVAGNYTAALSIGKSVLNGVALGTGLTINAYTGNTVQTGDSFARIGAAGAGLTAIDLPDQTMNITGNITGNLSGTVGSVTGAVGSVTGAVGSVTGLTASNLDATISSRATPAQVNTEVVDALATDTYAEPGQGAPAATTSLSAKLNYLYKWMRNKKTNDGTTTSFFADDATTVDQKQATSESAGTVTKGEIATGP